MKLDCCIAWKSDTVAVLTSEKCTQYVLCLQVLLVESGCQGCTCSFILVMVTPVNGQKVLRYN